MTTPSLYEATGLSVRVNESLVAGDRFLHSILNYDSYSHVISANKGYDSLNLTCKLRLADLEEWFENGLGRHVIVYNAGNAMVWEGFVNQITINEGRLQAQRGLLSNVVNRTWANYTPVNPDTSPPTRGTKTVTPAVQDAVSQLKYGVMEQVLNGGETTDALANQYCATYLAEYSEPETTHILGEPNPPNLALTCAGYYFWLDKIIYTNMAAPGTVVVSDPAGGGKLQQIIAFANSVNSWAIATDYSHMTYNGLLAPDYENDEKTCKAVAEELVALGDASNARYTLGIYDNRIAYYSAIPTTYDYHAQVLSNALVIESYNGTPIDPWDVRPAKWIFLRDFMAGRAYLTSSLRQDPRSVFVEQVTYTAHHGLTINGAKVGTVAQLLAKMGTGGRCA